jgi:hypothetical protein
LTDYFQKITVAGEEGNLFASRQSQVPATMATVGALDLWEMMKRLQGEKLPPAAESGKTL